MAYLPQLKLKFARLDQTSWLILSWVGIMSVAAISGIVTQRALYADGAQFFQSALINGSTNDPNHQRLFVNYLNQFLLQLGRFFPGLTYQLAIGLFSTPLFFWPVILPALGAWLIRKTQPGFSKLILIFQTAIALPSLMFVINPGLGFFSLLTLNLALLLRLKKNWSWEGFWLVILAGILFQSHETTLYLMPVLAGLSWWLYRKNHQTILLGLAGVYLVNFGYSLWWPMAHPIQAAGARYSGLLVELIERFKDFVWRTPLLYTLGLMGAVGLAGMRFYLIKCWPRRAKLWQRLEWLGVTGICLVVGGIEWQAFRAGMTWPSDDFKLRVLITPGALALAMAGFLPAKFWNQILKSGAVTVGLLVTSLFLGLWQINHSYRWHLFQTDVIKQIQVSDVSQPVNLAQVTTAEYHWDWTWPVYSMVLQQGQIKTILYPPTPGTDFEQEIKLPNFPGDSLKTPYSVWKDHRFLDLSQFKYDNQTRH